MTSNERVSVVLIFFNEERFLEEALHGVLAQTYSDWELLLVDDGSTNRSTAIAQAFAAAHGARVRYLEHPGHTNQGMSATRNLGIRNAAGKYVACLDSDDVWLPEKLENQVAILRAYPEVAMVCGPSLYWYSWSGDQADRERDIVSSVVSGADRIFDPPELLNLFLSGKANTPCPSNILFRREMVERIGPFDPSIQGIYQVVEDQVFLSKVFLHERVFVTEKYFDKYRRHANSFYSRAKLLGQVQEPRRKMLSRVESYLVSQNMKGSKSWDALQTALWPYRHPVLNRIAKSARYWRASARKLSTTAKSAKPPT